MIKTKRTRARDRARGLADNKLDKLAYSINDLQELGFGSGLCLQRNQRRG